MPPPLPAIWVGAPPPAKSAAEMAGYLGWSCDPAVAQTASGTLIAGTLYVQKIWVPAKTTITNISITIVTAGATLTAGQNFAGLFTSAGAQVGISADQSSAWTGTGAIVMALTSPYAHPGQDFVYTMLLSNGTTPPVLQRGSGNASVNMGLSGASLRFGNAGTGATALPGSFTPSALSVSNTAWAVALT